MWRFLFLATVTARRDVREARQHLEVTSPFSNAKMHARLELLLSSTAECGQPILKEVPISSELREEMQKRPADFFTMRSEKGDKVVYTGKGWPEEEGKILKVGVMTLSDLPRTMRITHPGELVDVLQSLTLLPKIVLETGTDLRRCWGDLEDLEGRSVCDERNIRELMEDVAASEEAKLDAVGKSGASIVTNMRRFVIKNFQEDEDPSVVAEVLPKFLRNFESRKKSSCFGTGLAPICAVLDLGAEGTWYIMRKIELNGERTEFKLKVDETVESVGFQDLKGPKFSGIRDGKSWQSQWGDDQVWRYKDAGFTHLFPQGLHLKPCGAKEVARTLQLDSQMLATERLTDYSLFLLPYKPDKTSECACGTGRRWPMVLDAESDGKSYRLAVGIIDYLEREVHFLEQFLGISMSTMKQPREYQSWWMRMWPNYFRLEGFSMKDGEVLGGRVERLRRGDRIVALQKIKWRGNGVGRTRSRIKDLWHKCYYEQLREVNSWEFVSGSKYQIYPGDIGTVVELRPCLAAEGQQGMQIKWDKYSKSKKVFEVTAEEVTSLG